MSPLKLIIALYLIQALLSASCVFVDKTNAQLEEIIAVRTRAFNGRPFYEDEGEHPDLLILDSRITKICPKPLSPMDLVSGPPAKEYLRGNPFTAVLAVQQGEERLAVKVLSFTHYLKSMLGIKLVQHENKDKLIEEVVKFVDSISLLSSPDSDSGDKLESWRRLEGNLGVISTKPFLGRVSKSLGQFALWCLQNYWKALIREIDIHQALQSLLPDLSKHITAYRGCYVDAKLNVYILTESPGPLLSAVRDSCSGPLSGSSPLDKIARYTGLFFTINELHRKGIRFCDARTEHMALAADFNPRKLFFADFSAAYKNKFCLGEVSAHTPPEAFAESYRQVAHGETVASSVRRANAFDAFSLGVLLTSFELTDAHFSVLTTSYKEGIATVKVSYENEVRRQKQHDLQNPGSPNPTAWEELTVKFAALFRKEASRLLANARAFLNKEVPVADRKDGDWAVPASQVYSQLVQQLINKVILGLLSEDYETRLSTEEALYLFDMLSRLVTEDIIMAREDESITSALKTLRFAEVLFDSTSALRLAMKGDSKSSDELAQELKAEFSDADTLRQALNGELANSSLSKSQKNLISQYGLTSTLRLPTYKQVLTELRQQAFRETTELLI